MCCGRSSGQYGRGASSIRGLRTVGEAARPTGLAFEYFGKTGLVVAGAVTGRRYRFDRPGSRLEVDPRDVASVAAVPVLRRVAPPSPRR